MTKDEANEMIRECLDDMVMKAGERGTGKVVANLKWANDEMDYAMGYLRYAQARAEVGEVRNARLIAEVAERSFLRAFLYIRNALEDAKDNEKNR
ncbi:MAG: hypothetical protein IIZ93_06730 [Acidaminococcaceae bacterium]|nr:hypothetical protein [Acidaminococcaceae bacterium]